MKVTIDGKLRDDIAIGDDTTLEQALLDINKQLLVDEHRIIAEIKVDETVPGLDMNLTPDQVTVDKVVSVSFQTESISVALLTSMESTETRIREFRETIASIVTHIISDEIDLGMQGLKQGIDVMILFFDTLHQATLTGIVDMQTISVGDDTLKGYITKLNEIFKELVLAMNNNDYTLINDYLEYEIEPALDKILDAIPQITARLRGE